MNMTTINRILPITLLLMLAPGMTCAAPAGFRDGHVGDKYFAVDAGFIDYGPGGALALSFGGGYQVHPAVAIEADLLLGGPYHYVLLGVPSSYRLSALQVVAVGHYTVSPDFSAYAKAGLAFNSRTLGNPPAGLAGTASSNDLTLAIGARLQVARDVALRAQYQDTGTSPVNVLSIGAEFAF